MKGRLLSEAGIETKVKSLLGLFLLNDQGGIYTQVDPISATIVWSFLQQSNQVRAEMSLPIERQRKFKVSFRKKLLFSVFVTVVFFSILEVALTLVGFQSLTSTEDPFVGFSGQIPLFQSATNEQGVSVLTTAENKLHWFNKQSFPKSKTPGTLRVFCMGGSTTYGHPYWDPTSFPGWMREVLPSLDPSKRWEVINAGGISYASYRVTALMEELSQYEPDLFVIYSVHNEFLERRTYQSMFEKSELNLQVSAWLTSTRIWALFDRILHSSRKANRTASVPDRKNIELLPAEVDEVLNHTIGPVDYHRDESWRASILKHYESNLRRMILIAKRSGAKIVFITPASNEKDCSPFKSEHSPNLTPVDLQKLRDLEESSSLVVGEQTDAKHRIEAWQAAIRIDPTFSEYHYRLGRAYFDLQRYEESQKAFSQSIQDDVCPLRAVSEIREAIERVAIETHVPIVDFNKLLRALCKIQNGHSILGEEYFLDHVHPTIDVNRRLALRTIEVLQSHRIVGGPPIQEWLLSDDCKQIERKVLYKLDQVDQGGALRNLAKVLHWAGKYDEAIPRANDALELLPNDLESQFVLADCLTNVGDPRAIDEFDKLFANQRDFPRAYFPYAAMLAKHGRLEQSKAYFLLTILQDGKNSNAFLQLGIVHLRLGEYSFALESLEQSDKLYSGQAETLFYTGQATARLGDHERAIALYKQVLNKGIQAANVHYQLGLSLVAIHRLSEAAVQFKAALELAPDWEEVREQLDRISNKNF